MGYGTPCRLTVFDTWLFDMIVDRHMAEPIEIGFKTCTGNEKVHMAEAFHPQTLAYIRRMATCAGPGQLESPFDNVIEPLHFQPPHQGPKRFNAPERLWFQREKDF